jgi:predicted Rossmann fold nucleotide-binding protein DprA/Smf involved in DNA uptake
MLIQAQNYETLVHALQKEEPQLIQLLKHTPPAEPLVDHLLLYSRLCNISSFALLESYKVVKEAFEPFQDSDSIISLQGTSAPFLYLRGDHSLLDKPIITITGTKRPSIEALMNLQQSIIHLSKHHVIALSGIDSGVERSVHTISAKISHPSIAVIRTSLSEVKESSSHIPLANTLKGRLSEATCIIEAFDGEASVKQVHYALEQQKQVLLFEHTAHSRSLMWPRKLTPKELVSTIKKGNEIYKKVFVTPIEVDKRQLTLF